MKNFLIKLVLFVFIVFSGLNSAEAVIQGWVPPENYGEGDSYEMGMESEEAVDDAFEQLEAQYGRSNVLISKDDVRKSS